MAGKRIFLSHSLLTQTSVTTDWIRFQSSNLQTLFPRRVTNQLPRFFPFFCWTWAGYRCLWRCANSSKEKRNTSSSVRSQEEKGASDCSGGAWGNIGLSPLTCGPGSIRQRQRGNVPKILDSFDTQILLLVTNLRRGSKMREVFIYFFHLNFFWMIRNAINLDGTHSFKTIRVRFQRKSLVPVSIFSVGYKWILTVWAPSLLFDEIDEGGWAFVYSYTYN